MKGIVSRRLHLLRPVSLLGCLRLARVHGARGQISGQVNSGSVLGSASGCISDSALNPKSARGAEGSGTSARRASTAGAAPKSTEGLIVFDPRVT